LEGSFWAAPGLWVDDLGDRRTGPREAGLEKGRRDGRPRREDRSPPAVAGVARCICTAMVNGCQGGSQISLADFGGLRVLNRAGLKGPQKCSRVQQLGKRARI